MFSLTQPQLFDTPVRKADCRGRVRVPPVGSGKLHRQPKPCIAFLRHVPASKE